MLYPLHLHGMKRMFARFETRDITGRQDHRLGILRGGSFPDLFINRSHWPRLNRQGYEAGTPARDRFRDPAGPS